MRALSIIGIVMSVVGLITCIYIMTESTCSCSCDEDYYYSNNSIPGEAVGGSMINMLLFIFFLVMSIVGVSKSYSNNPNLSQAIPPFQANPYPNYQQPYQPSQQYQQNPYQQNHYQNPVPPQQNPYQNPPPPTQNPYQHPNPFQNPDQDQTPPGNTPPPANPWEPK